MDIHPYQRIFLFFLPCFLIACSLAASLDRGTKTPGPACIAGDCPPGPTPAPARPVSPSLGTNLAADRPVVSRDGGITYADWGGADDGKDYGTTTRASGGRWGNQTNTGGGTYEVVDLGRPHTLTGVGYTLDWDQAFANPLTFQVLVSSDAETWMLVASTVHNYSGGGVGNHVDIDIAIDPVRARYVKYWEPPDGDWNGWGDFFQLRAYGE